MTPIRITADDYGLDPEVNRGIEDLALAGAVQAVSIMAHRGAHLDTLPRLQASGVRLGVHLVLVEERPLLGEGPLPPGFRSLFLRLLRRPALAGDLVLEARAQVDRLRAEGLALAFINSHQHVHLFPPLWRALRPWLATWGLEVRAARRWVPSPLKQALVETSSCLSLGLWPLPECPTVHPVGIHAAGRLDLETLAQGARCCRRALALGEPLEWVCHPGYERPELRARYGAWDYHWQDELTLLKAGQVRRVLDSWGTGGGVPLH